MQVRSFLASIAAGAACCALILVGGCGDAAAPTPTPTPAAAPATVPATAPATAPAAMGDMHHDGDAPAMMAAAAPTKAFMCGHCGTAAEKAGECPMCHMAMTETPIANPDPSCCPVTGEKIEKPVLVVVDGKVYDCCDTDCMDELKKDPAGCMKKAQERADAAKTAK